MKPTQCHSLRVVDQETAVFLCAHPQVHTRNQRVTNPVCQCCGHWKEAPPARFRDLREERKRVSISPLWRPEHVAVVIPCHNYGRYLGEAIESVLAQSHKAAEVAVVDDASSDDTREVAKRYRDEGVRYLRVDLCNSQQARRVGWEATTSDVLCFLDADDMLAPDYLQKGLAAFDDYRVGVVYSDVQCFGATSEKIEFSAEGGQNVIALKNFLHAGCLVLREALDISQALEQIAEDREGLPDWLLWRRVLADGWQVKKQPSVYRYRRHNNSMGVGRQHWGGRYFERASLSKEVVTLFVPLSGRDRHWASLAQFLERQNWPHNQIKLILFDSGQNSNFSVAIRAWVARCDYADVRHVRLAVGRRGLADEPRREVHREVSLAMARIYNWMAREATTDYVWVLEDDMVPPNDACEQLLKGFDERTASVSAAYWSRFANGYVAWEPNQRRIVSKGRGLARVGGNGFGCVLLRGNVLRETVFTATIDHPAYDNAFYHRLRRTGLAAKVNWSVECEHLE